MATTRMSWPVDVPRSLASLWNNPLLLVVLAQALFIILGVTFFSFDITWLQLAAAVLTAAAAEIVLARLSGKAAGFPLSAIAAALGLGLFLRSPYVSVFMLAAAVAIASKYVVRRDGRHVFNPSNLGILLVVFTFPSFATIEFTQWGNDLFAYVFISTVTFVVAWRAGALPITASFLASYSVILLILLPLVPHFFSAHHYGLLGPSLALFASFMITDPRTAPKGMRAMLIHGVAVAALYFYLEMQGVRYSLFLASFLVAALNVVSGLVYDRVSDAARSILVARNSMTGVICVGLLVVAGSSVVAANTAQFSVLRVSPRFLAMGIEGGPLLQCRDNAVFSARAFDESKGSNTTYGAAWGDYDSDGDDDLFVSQFSRPSSLYRNDGGTFTDVTQEVGLSELSVSSGFFADYDDDGRLDLFLAGYRVPTDRSADLRERLTRFVHTTEHAAVQVYRNTGNRFVNVTDRVGLDVFHLSDDTSATMSFADYDSDGDLDFVLASRGRAFSLNSETERTALEKNLFDPFFETSFVLLCAEDDVRRALSSHVSSGLLSEGDVDLYIAQRGCVRYQRSLPFFAGTRAQELAIDSTTSLEFSFHVPGSAHLFENRGGTMFQERKDFARQALSRLPEEPVSILTQYHPFDTVSGRFYQPVSFDRDDDGDMDVFLAVDVGTNILFDNLGGLRFEDVTLSAGLDYLGSGMGADVADVDRNGSPDVFVTNTLQDYLFLGDGDVFSLYSGSHMGRIGVGWGVSFLDYDLDGFEDVVIANGDIQMTTDVPLGVVGKSLFRANLLLSGDGTGAFRDTTWDDLCTDFQSSMALAVSDYDDDGDPDVFVGNVLNARGQTNTNVLYTNHTEGKSYLKIRLVGTVSNAFGVGASVSVTDSKGAVQTKYVTLGSSFYSQNSLALLFGLGEDTGPVDVHVRWPSGKLSHLSNVDIQRALVVSER